MCESTQKLCGHEECGLFRDGLAKLLAQPSKAPLAEVVHRLLTQFVFDSVVNALATSCPGRTTDERRDAAKQVVKDVIADLVIRDAKGLIEKTFCLKNFIAKACHRNQANANRGMFVPYRISEITPDEGKARVRVPCLGLLTGGEKIRVYRTQTVPSINNQSGFYYVTRGSSVLNVDGIYSQPVDSVVHIEKPISEGGPQDKGRLSVRRRLTFSLDVIDDHNEHNSLVLDNTDTQRQHDLRKKSCEELKETGPRPEYEGLVNQILDHYLPVSELDLEVFFIYYPKCQGQDRIRHLAGELNITEEKFKECLKRAEDHEVLRMRRAQGMTINQIAEAMNVDSGTIQRDKGRAGILPRAERALQRAFFEKPRPPWLNID